MSGEACRGTARSEKRGAASYVGRAGARDKTRVLPKKSLLDQKNFLAIHHYNMSLFLIATSGFVALVALLVHFRVTRKITKKRKWRVLWFIVSLILGATFVWAIRGRRFIQPVDGTYDFVTIGFCGMTFVALLVALLVVRDVVLGVGFGVTWLRRLRRHESDEKTLESAKDADEEAQKRDGAAVESRRDFLMRVSSLGVLGGTVVLTPPTIYSAKCRRVIRKTQFVFSKLPAACDGLKIAHLSDIHVGNTITRSDVEDMVRETNALDPDIVVITGDIADGDPQYVVQDLSPLRGLKSRYGAYYVTGNHEHMWGARGYCQAVAQLGIVVLNNEHRIIDVNGAQLAVAGAIDYRGDRRERTWQSDPALALSGIPENVFKLMLVHQPGSVDESLTHGADLVLVGHTHGGQCWPFRYIVDALHKYSRGAYWSGERAVFVSCGTGYWGPPIRLGVPCEICLHTLKARG